MANQKITPFLWFDTQAEEAANFYISIFKNSEIHSISHYGEGAPGTPGTVMTVAFRLDGQELIALNGGPMFRFTEAISLSVDCESQAEVDELWDTLTADGGEPGPCGWLKDKFGLSWQIVPRALMEMLGDEDRERANRVMQAMPQMGKLEIPKLRAAYEQG